MENTMNDLTLNEGSQLNMLPGPIHIKKSAMSVLLVFGKEDAQSEAFLWAADQAGYSCSLVRNAENALESFLEKQHDIVIIDHRPHKYFDPDPLCRSLRATQCSDHSVIVAVTRRCRDNEEEPAVRPLLSAGFTRRFVECSKRSVCANELLMLEHSDVRLLQQKRAAKALVTALDNCSEAVDITSEDPRQFQFVNSAYERLLGCSSDEVIGRDTSVGSSEKNRQEIFETINAQLKKGKVWEGTLWCKRKTGEHVQNLCRVIPVMGHKGQLQHYVTVRSTRDLDLMTGNNQFMERRRESATGIHSMTIEPPITKVINIINAAQQNSPVPVAQALDRVLDMLRSSELYSPEIDHQITSDQIISGLVGGLMSAESSITLHSSGSTRRRSSITDFQNKVVFGDGSSPTPTDLFPSEVETLLEKEASWDMDVFALEKITSKRPLRYLAMKTFQRFGVLSFLRCSERVMANWLQLIEANYHSNNTYHNSTHAADVVHATAYFLSCHRVKDTMDEIDAVAALLAAAVHDVDHPGRTNTFLVNSGSPLAILYNDAAVLENHHSSLAFRMTSKDPVVNIFKNLDREDYRALRQMMVDMVLATEMTKHFEHLSKFNSAITKKKKVPTATLR